MTEGKKLTPLSGKKREYILVVFLLTEASISRITFALLQKGYGVTPWTESGSMICANPKSSASVPICLLVSDESGTLTDVSKASAAFSNLLVALDVPYFGSFVCTLGSKIHLGSGRMPQPKKKESPPPAPTKDKFPALRQSEPGPYRKDDNNVVPFAKKDDGIIDDSKER